MAFKRSSVRSRLAPLYVPQMRDYERQATLEYFVYILHSSSRKSYYIGHTKDILNRLEYHNNGYSKSTKSGIPWELVHEEEFTTRSLAMKREMEIKSKKSKKYIEWLINK